MGIKAELSAPAASKREQCFSNLVGSKESVQLEIGKGLRYQYSAYQTGNLSQDDGEHHRPCGASDLTVGGR